MAKTRLSAQQIGEKWKRRTGAAVQDYQQGVNNATGWAEGATRAVPRTHAGLQQAIAENRIANGIAAAGDGKWKRAATTRGVANFASGVNAGVDNMVAGAQKNLQMLSEADAAIASIPTDTLESRLERSRQHNLAMAAAKRRMKGGA
jgi:hypothetical protein